MTIAGQLARFTTSLGKERLGDPVRNAFRLHLLDFFGAAVAGASEGVTEQSLDALCRMGSMPQSSILGRMDTVSAADAMFVNAVSAHSLELDDGHTGASLHPAVVIFPVVLALGERMGLSTDDLIVPTVVGYEVMIRIGMAMHPHSRRHGFHNTAIAGVFGAAAAAAHMLQLDEAQTVHALGLAGSHAAGLFEFLATGADSKRIHPGRAARDGWLCAELARSGVTGPESVFEGTDGFFQAYAGAWKEHVFDGLGDPFQITQSYVKPYPCCRHLHAALDAVLEAKAKGLSGDVVDHVEIETYEVAARHHGHNIRSMLDAQMSLPFAVSLALEDSAIPLAAFRQAPDNAARWEEKMQRVTVHTRADLNNIYPRLRPAEVHFHGPQGALSVRVDVPLGEPDRPLSAEQVARKFTDLTEGVLGSTRVETVINLVAKGGDIRTLMKNLRPADAAIAADGR
ncbi:MmgE/PrpD family protein [Alicyclobacillus cycloheptanicus]|uniref:2-methylcitrate dehydratase PrpD n=1 Tax=Alicyclobacillus cycloheptanicus TaxID=1457 RepID=A0ABT9XML2_9BACL|nr:MmgE/PrpD family protein [Alicyclobacillus cycloheptanicus]MDQ0191462.1 2-methylcitrate dehydratase PrpD [Alicyclobacillus cycloheptanicus]WDM00162.1 MmgE/PrpD family protein [Alicyclobacillus cycloheptanicus]